MVKTIFVNGNLLVKTQYFMPIDIGVGYETPPEGAIILDPKDEVDGYKCLLIDDDHPQSLFYEYYVKGDVNTDVKYFKRRASKLITYSCWPMFYVLCNYASMKLLDRENHVPILSPDYIAVFYSEFLEVFRLYVAIILRVWIC